MSTSAEFLDQSPLPQSDHLCGNPASITRRAERVALALEATAVERDRLGGHASVERQILRDSGLLNLSIPKHLGGPGAPWTSIFQVVRRLAEADSALAHLFGFHHLQIATVLLFGSAAQQAHFCQSTLRDSLFWGNALNPLDRRTLVIDHGDGHFRIDGIKSFSSGSVGSDMLTVSAWDEASQSALIAAVPTQRTGISVLADWDAFGQKQTDSGQVRFDSVVVEPIDVLQKPGSIATPRSTLRTQVAQLVMANLYLGIAQGAFAHARQFCLQEGRPWFDSGVERACQDPFVIQQFGEFWLQLRPATVLADLAASRLSEAIARGSSVSVSERGGVALAVAEAKVLAHRAALDISTRMFEVTGARSTSARYGFDRFWRNARVHTLHDPVDYKIRDLGRWALLERHPDPTPYS